MATKTLEYSGRQWTYSWWNGQLLKGSVERPISVDLETAKIKPARPPKAGEDEDDVPMDPLDVPVPALAMATDDTNLYLIHIGRLPEFIQKHKQHHWVFHNAAFDWWVMQRHVGNALTKEYLWQLADNNYLHDTMLMDMLLQLATGKLRKLSSSGEQKLYPTNLGVLAEEWGAGRLNKDDPFRTKFGQLIGLTEEQIEALPEFESFATYALCDVLACHQVFPKQRSKGLELMRKAGWNPDPKTKLYEIRPDAVEKFGVLSEQVQLKASLALSQLSRTPIRIDLERRQKMEEAARRRHQQYLNSLLEREPELVKRTKAKYKKVKVGKGKNAVKTKVLVKASEIIYTKKAGVPSFNNAKLLEVLQQEADQLGIEMPVSDGIERRKSLSAKQWQQWAEESTFIKNWVSLEKEGKNIEDLCRINAPEVYAKYDLLKTTGRTGAGYYADGRSGNTLVPSLNIQNVKRDNPNTPDENLRPLFLPPVGYEFAAVDYAYIELRAMSAILLSMYGWSKMAEGVREHTKGGKVDPHQRTAAKVLGLNMDDFFKLDKKLQKLRRQEAKIANFGFCSGMGAETLLKYAEAQGVYLKLEQAKEIKAAFRETYPEMNLYLKGSVYDGLMWETDRKSGPQLKEQQHYRLSKFLKTTDGPDPEYDPDAREEVDHWSERQRFWEVLEWAAKHKGDQQTQDDVRLRRVTHRVRKLTYYRSCTLTGRIRNHCSYTEERNHRFQAVSADGAKMALFKLMRKGFHLLSFIHDEICVALPKGVAQRQVKDVERIMIEEMEKVLGQGVPVAVASELAPCWSKA